MEDFLKDRPVVQTTVRDTANEDARERHDRETPFGALDRSAAHAGGGAAQCAKESAGSADRALAGEDGARVETVVVGGRVTRIIVTCSCGKVTEIGCTY